MHPLRAAALLLLCAATLTLLGAAPAAASCATASPDPSPHAFVGTVVATSEGDRVAEVVTDEGVTVVVEGADVGWLSTPHGSTDRRYAVGGRYEFHPVDDDSPFEDNACTATRQLSGPPLATRPDDAGSNGILPAWLPVDEQSGPLGYALLMVPLAVAALGLSVLARRTARSRRDRGVAGHPG